jgi:hypothetical protein
MDAMNSPRKPTASDELERIEDALVESLLEADGQDVRGDIGASGDPAALISNVDAAIASARADAAQARLERARAELSAWQAKSGPISPLAREAARTRFERLQSDKFNPEAKMTMAARKGKGLSDSDLEGVLEDMADLERLENDSNNG